MFNPLNAKLNPICQLLALLGAHLILHISRIRVKKLILALYNSAKAEIPTVLTIFNHTHYIPKI
jgi:hypothetical protein